MYAGCMQHVNLVNGHTLDYFLYLNGSIATLLAELLYLLFIMGRRKYSLTDNKQKVNSANREVECLPGIWQAIQLVC